MLGIDIGTTRLRVAFGRSTRSNGASVVVARDIPNGSVRGCMIVEPDLLAALIEDAVHEIGERDRRCVSAIGLPDARLKLVRYPCQMRAGERKNAARLESARKEGREADTSVRVHRYGTEADVYAVGSADRSALASHVTALRAAGLRPVAVDFDGIALRRSYPEAEAVLDVGLERMRLHALSDVAALSLWTACGGASVTEGIARALELDPSSAESRKRVVGTAGAGDAQREAMLREACELICSARYRTAAVNRVAVVGNGARLTGFCRDLERLAGVSIVRTPMQTMQAGAYPSDVLRAAAPDWALAAGLAMWGER